MLAGTASAPAHPDLDDGTLPERDPDPALTLEFLLRPDDIPALARLPDLTRSAPSRPVRLLWYDDEAHTLAADGLSLLRDGALWEIGRLEPGADDDWPACTAAPRLSRAADPANLSPSVPFDIVPVSAFDGRARSYRAGDVAVAVLHGTVRGVVETRPACRLALSGPAFALTGLLPALTTLGVSVPRATLAREAIAAARGTPTPARHLGAPSVAGDVSVSDGLTAIIGHLLDVLLFWTDEFRRQREAEAIHQARVATRRLRSALAIYGPTAPCAELTEAAAAVKHCASMLGAARDWDVFLAGTGARLAEASGRDARILVLLRTAARRRDAAYAELADYLEGPRFRHLELSLGAATALRPWDWSGPNGPDLALHAPTAPFAVTVLDRRLKRVRHRGRQIETLSVPVLHELRKDCKRLRYAAEFFAPAFLAKRAKPFLRPLSALQEELGRLNDAAASGLLMAQLGRSGRGYAGGMVDGMAAAAATPARVGIVKSWRRFKRADPFWR